MQDWTEYDEKVKESVGIYEVTHKFIKCWSPRMSLQAGPVNTTAKYPGAHVLTVRMLHTLSRLVWLIIKKKTVNHSIGLSIHTSWTNHKASRWRRFFSATTTINVKCERLSQCLSLRVWMVQASSFVCGVCVFSPNLYGFPLPTNTTLGV